MNVQLDSRNKFLYSINLFILYCIFQMNVVYLIFLNKVKTLNHFLFHHKDQKSVVICKCRGGGLLLLEGLFQQTHTERNI